MAGGKSPEEFLKKIISIELRMFMTVQTSGPTTCQKQPEAFKLTRKAGFYVLSHETLESYINDLQEAMKENRNLIELKYARIDGLIPPLSVNPLIEKIVEVEERWLKELEKKYPSTFRGWADFAFKGIGPYTAGALISFAFRKRAPILDTNVARVLFRVVIGRGNPKSHRMRRHLWKVSALMVPHRRAFDFNQAIMDFGALVCTARRPTCGTCPMSGWCRAYPFDPRHEGPPRCGGES